MEEKELIDLLNDIHFGEMVLHELSSNSIKKARVIKEIRKLYGMLDPDYIHIVFVEQAGTKTTGGVFTSSVRAEQYKDKLHNKGFRSWIVDMKEGLELV